LSQVTPLFRPAEQVSVYEMPKGTWEEGFPLEPFDDIVYVEQITEEVTKGGILIANTDEARMSMGRVVAVGPGKLFHAPFNVTETHTAVVFVPTKLKVGDVVAWGRYTSGGEPKIINGKTIIGAREGDLGGRVIPNADGTLPVIKTKQQ
jgi:co-chaperonin GroES (HSP10)